MKQNTTPHIVAPWIWYPEERTLPNTFVFFRKVVNLPNNLHSSSAWISADSRYILYVNGELVQRGPAPCDPRLYEVDPVDLAPYLRKGLNVLGAIICYYGHGEGTYVPSAPGFLFQAEILTDEGSLKVYTDDAWKAHRARCWRPGNFRRWFLRSLQEEFDSRLYPNGWLTLDYNDSDWVSARPLPIPPGKPTLYAYEDGRFLKDLQLTSRPIPPMQETSVPARKLCDAGWIKWKRLPEEYFECFTRDAFDEDRSTLPLLNYERIEDASLPLKVSPSIMKSAVLTFDFGEIMTGYPYIRLRAPAGTKMELIFAEARRPEWLILRTWPSFGSWARLITSEGETAFKTFEYEAVRFLQLVIRNSSKPVDILEVGLYRRTFAFDHEPDFVCSDNDVNRVFAGAVNTAKNVLQETIVDNIVRERQQYSGDVDHGKLAAYYGFGEYRLPERMIRTYVLSQTPEGWLMSCWPGWDRLERLWQWHLKVTRWAPELVDHSLTYPIGLFRHYLFTGNKKLLKEIYPRLQRLDQWFSDNAQSDGLLPVIGWRWGHVWIDHTGWREEIDKHASLNLLYIGYIRAMRDIAFAIGESLDAEGFTKREKVIMRRVQELYWSSKHQLFVDNLPRLDEESKPHLHDRTLSMSLLYDTVPRGKEKTTLDLLANPTPKLELSGPYNQCWRLWTLARFGRGADVVQDLRTRWGNMESLREGNTFSESWQMEVPTGSAWCQNAAIPLFILYDSVLGIVPMKPGFEEFDAWPQLGTLKWVRGTVHTVRGSILLNAETKNRELLVNVKVPAFTKANIIADKEAEISGVPDKVESKPAHLPNICRWALPPKRKDETWKLVIRSRD